MHQEVHEQKVLEPVTIRVLQAVWVQISDLLGGHFYTQIEFRLQLIWKGRIYHRFPSLRIQREGGWANFLAQYLRKHQRNRRPLVLQQKERYGAALVLELAESFAVVALVQVVVCNTVVALGQEELAEMPHTPLGQEEPVEMPHIPKKWTVQSSSAAAAAAAGGIHVASFEQLGSKNCRTERVPLEQVLELVVAASAVAAALPIGSSAAGEPGPWAVDSLMAVLLRSSFRMNFDALQVAVVVAAVVAAAAASHFGCS